MNKLVNFMVKEKSVTLVFSDGPHTVCQGQPHFEDVLQALRSRDYDRLEQLVNPTAAIFRFSKGDCEIVGNDLFYKGEKIHGYLTNKIMQFIRDDLPWEHLVAFMDNLQRNESSRAREELYKFLETEDMPVTEDGHFLAYKAVKSDWTDYHTGTIDNSVGQIVSMPRRGVDDNQSKGCSHGLHAGSLEYVRGFHRGGHVIIVKINPADVVCIPSEDCRKLRCCRYEVLKEMDTKLLFPSYSSDGQAAYGQNANEMEVPVVVDDWSEIKEEVLDDIEANLDVNNKYDKEDVWEEDTQEFDYEYHMSFNSHTHKA